MPIAYDVLVFYGLLVIWAVLLANGVRSGNYRWFLGFGVLIALGLNIRYFIEGQAASIAFFIGIYDVFDNLGLDRGDSAPALAQCVDNACTVWGERYENHPSWGVAFYDRFANASTWRSNLLYGHIAFNSVAFVLMHYQLMRPPTAATKARHRLAGRMAYGSLVLGTIGAVLLASEHGEVSAYGGMLAELGFYSMSAFVFTTATVGVLAARSGDVVRHRKWMMWWAGSMWGSFWLFRVMLVVTGPLLRQWESASILLSIWLSAPLGILLAEFLRRRSMLRDHASQPSERVVDLATT